MPLSLILIHVRSLDRLRLSFLLLFSFLFVVTCIGLYVIFMSRNTSHAHHSRSNPQIITHLFTPHCCNEALMDVMHYSHFFHVLGANCECCVRVSVCGIVSGQSWSDSKLSRIAHGKNVSNRKMSSSSATSSRRFVTSRSKCVL